MKIFLLLLLGALAGAGIVGIHRDSTRLRGRIAEARRQHELAAHLRGENQRTQKLVMRSANDAAGAAQAIHADLERARGEVAALEKHATERHAQLAAKSAADATALATNRDPKTGLTRLERFQNTGQATPAAAFQTLVWAAMKGDEAMLAQVGTISAAARTKAEALIAGLPEGGRAQWTPEKIAAMFFTGAFGEVTAAQIAQESPKDAGHVALGIRITNGDKEQIVTFQWQLGASGWQVVFDEKLLGAVQKKIANALGPPAPKK